MTTAKCIVKHRNDKGVIVNYILQDQNGQKKEFTASEIKQLINSKQLEVTNLQIDKLGRLVDKAEEKPVKAKVKNVAPSKKEVSKKEKVAVAKKEVNDYIKYMKEEYGDDYFGAEKFLKDLTGEGNVEYKDGEILEVCHMTDDTRKYFNKLIKMIEEQAIKKGELRAYRYDYGDFSVELPDYVEKFMESSGLSCEITEVMFYQAAKNSKLALLSNGLETMSEGFVGEMILTPHYTKAKEFIMESIKQEAYNQGITPTEVIANGNFAEGSNTLGHVFVLKFMAELQKHDVDYYKKQVLELAQTSDYMCYSSGTDESIRRVLRHEACGLSYLALKLGVLPARDDWDTEEEREVEDKITAEAKRLAAEFEKTN